MIILSYVVFCHVGSHLCVNRTISFLPTFLLVKVNGCNFVYIFVAAHKVADVVLTCCT